MQKCAEALPLNPRGPQAEQIDDTFERSATDWRSRRNGLTAERIMKGLSLSELNGMAHSDEAKRRGGGRISPL